MLRVQCPKCPKTYRVEEGQLGSHARCKSCGHTFTLSMSVDETRGSIVAARTISSNRNVLIPSMLGPYVVVKKLGAGAMGEVWLGQDPALRRDAAIKVLPTTIAHDSVRLKRFTREAQLAAQLHHTNVVTIYNFGVTEDYAFIAMEFVDGPTLHRAIDDRGPFDWREATQVICHAARGLAAAHEIGLVHRDIKPCNLMQTSKGITKVVDFGLARESLSDTHLTQDGTLLGTPAYMAPEQWVGSKVDARSDLYSLICTYYFLLTGQLPFDAPSLPALGYQHRYEPFPAARGLVPNLPGGVCRILACGSQKKPDDRYQSADDLISELEAILTTPQLSEMCDRPRQDLVAKQSPPVVVGDASLTLQLRGQPVLRRLDRFLRQMVGADNTVLYSFLRISVLLLLVTTIVITASLTGRRAWNGLQSLQIWTATTVTQSPVLTTDSSQAKENDSPVLTASSRTSESGSVIQLKVQGPITAGSLTSTATLASQLASSQQRVASERNIPTEESTKCGLVLKLITPVDALDPEPFYLGIYEVTQSEYQHLMEENPSAFSNRPKSRGEDKVRGLTTGSFPVDSVSWPNAASFCNRLSTLEGLSPYYKIESNPIIIQGGSGYRLPTFDEWWYACKPYGLIPQPFDDYCWHRSNAGERSHQVGTKKPNIWGLCDTFGNLAELGWSVPGAIKNYNDGNHVYGGSFVHSTDGCQLTWGVWPRFASHDGGFRVARDANPRTSK